MAQVNRGFKVVGFLLGAMWAVQHATGAPEHVGAFERSTAAFLGHFGEQDAWEPPENVSAMEQALHAAGRHATIHRYPAAGHWCCAAGHWCCAADRPGAFRPEAADRAWQRTVSFLHQQLR